MIDDTIEARLREEKAELVRTRNDLGRNIVRGTDATSRLTDRVNATSTLEREAARAIAAGDASRINALRDSHRAANAHLAAIERKKSSVNVTVNTSTTVALSASAIALQVQRVTTTNNINSPDPGSVF